MGLLQRLPGMLRAMCYVLLLDLAGVVCYLNGASGFAILLYIASSITAFWGGLEAVHWILRSSPWVRLLQMLAKEMQQPRPESIHEESTPVDHWITVFRDLPLEDKPELRRGLIRLLSGAGLAFVALGLIRYGLPTKATTLVVLFHMEWLRLAPLVIGAVVSAPLLAVLMGREDPPRGSEWLHVALAVSLSVAGAVLLHGFGDYVKMPPGRYLEELVKVALDLGGVFYGFMVGGVFWWFIGLAGAVMRRQPPPPSE